MATIQLTGRITDTGKLELELPDDLPPGVVNVTIETEPDPDDLPITPEELKELMRVEPMTGAEIIKAGIIGGWEDKGITDSAAWVEELRRERDERFKW